MANLNNAYLIDKRKAKNEESTEALVPEYWGWRRMFHNCVLHIPHSLFPLSELPMSVSSFPRHFFPSSRLEFLQINTIKQTCSLSLLLHMMPPVLFSQTLKHLFVCLSYNSTKLHKQPKGLLIGAGCTASAC